METTVYFSADQVDFKTRLRNWWLRLGLTAVIQHLGLLLVLMVYTVGGGLIFRELEYPAEKSRLSHLNTTIHTRRKTLVDNLFNNTNLMNFKDFALVQLRGYEKVLQEAFSNGLESISEVEDIQTAKEMEKWTKEKAVFFSSTVLTTIGYGNIVPMTTGGRAFCMVFALVGIPLTLTVIADWGRLFASTLSTVMHHIPPLPASCRRATEARRTSSYALSAVCFLFIYLAAGAGLFVIWEEDWTFFDGFYFCFITMTTIGFGDLVPKKPKYMLLCTLYILVGLALTSTIIELVRRQYAQSWRQLQALSGPLAENLRKLAENRPGLDYAAFQQDLWKVLTVVSMPKKSIGQGSKAERKKRQKEWEETMEAMIRDITTGATTKQVQIVIYESSV